MKIIDYVIKGLKNINLFPKVEIKIGIVFMTTIYHYLMIGI